MMTATRLAALFTVLVGAAALGVAFAAEDWGGLVPCALCLVERWPWRIAIGLGVVALLLPRELARPVLGLAGLTALAAAALGFVHVGVEQGWWPSPLPECAAPMLRGGTIAERLANMPALPAKPCDDPTYPIPAVPVSMAAMGMAYALAFSLALAIFLVRTRRRPR